MGFGHADTAPVMTTPQLYYPTLHTVTGNPHGKITIVEFFDYDCQYCRHLAPLLSALVDSNHDIRIVYRDYPLLSAGSLFAARMALGAIQQEKYLALHSVLFATYPLPEKIHLLDMAQAANIDTHQLVKDAFSDAVNQQLDTNAALADGLGIKGIPVLVVARTPEADHAGAIPAYVLISPSPATLQSTIVKVNHADPT
jgi:protein-disulfide isomerase